MREETRHGLPELTPTLPEEEEMSLSTDRRVEKKEEDYKLEETERGRQMSQLAMRLAILALLVLVMLFGYRKLHSSPQHGPKRQVSTSLQEEMIVEVKKEEEPVTPFELERTIWYYADNAEEMRQLRLLCEANNRRMANTSNFTFISLNKLVSHEYLSDSANKILETVENALIKRKDYKHILRMLTLLFILHQHGGIAISQHILLTEDLAWLQQIRRSPFLNGNFNGQKIEIVGFYNPEMSSEPQVAEWGSSPWKWPVASPSLQPYFLAANKDTSFLQQLIKRLSKALISSQTISNAEKQMAKHSKHDIFDHLFKDISMTILKEKGGKALMSYGLALINQDYAPARLERLMRDASFEQRSVLLSHLDLNELQDSFGKFSYMTLLDEEQWKNYLSIFKLGGKTVMEGSFIRQFLLPDPKLHGAYSNTESEAATDALWTELPKIVWVYAPNGVQNSGIVKVLTSARISKNAVDAKYEFRQVNDSNIHAYISNSTLQAMERAVEKEGVDRESIWYELVRLALLMEHGGVFIDLSIVLVQGLDWLQQIASIASGRIFDRCGSVPKAFMLWHPFETHPLSWNISQQCNTKSLSHPSYLSAFIAADQHNLLIKEWFQMYISLLSMPKDQVQETFDECGISSSGFAEGVSEEKLGMDALKCVLGNREKAMEVEIDGVTTTPSQFYQLWSMSSLIGQQKTSPHSFLERDALYQLTQFPAEFLDEARGQVHYFFKLSTEQVDDLTDFFVQHHQDLKMHVRADSVIGKHLLGPSAFRLVYEGGTLRMRQE